MQKFYNLMGLFFLISSYLSADVFDWDIDMVRSYVHYSDLQRRWAWSFLAPHLKAVQADAKILDIGCGDGKITADIAKFIPKGSILGIDLSNAMLEWAKKQYHPQEYPNLFFKEGSFLETGISDQFDLIVSFCALQHCTDQKGW
ncbi:MAG: methyltransferase domain-containing protein [Candidatus Babeliales bacterium]